MGKNAKQLFMRAFKCPQCRQMDRFVDLLQYKANTPFVIECGNEVGSLFTIVQRSVYHLHMTPEENPRKDNFSQQALLLSCQNEGIAPTRRLRRVMSDSSLVIPVKDIDEGNNMTKYYNCDPFTNEVLITTFINDYLDFYHLPTTYRLHTAFVCGEDGYILYETPELYYIQPSLKVAEGIVYQLISTLHCLSKQQFTHGSLTQDSLSLVKRGCDYDYDGVLIAYDFTVKLGNFKLSSITVSDGIQGGMGNGEMGNVEMWNGEIRHGEIRHGEIRHGEIRHGEVKQREVRQEEIREENLKKRECKAREFWFYFSWIECADGSTTSRC